MNVRLTMAAVAERIGVPVTTLRNWVFHPKQRKPDFPRPHLVAEGMGRSKARWDAAEVDAWRARHVR